MISLGRETAEKIGFSSQRSAEEMDIFSKGGRRRQPISCGGVGREPVFSGGESLVPIRRAMSLGAEGGIPTHPPSSFIFFTGRFFLPIMHCCRKQGITGLGDGPGGRHWRETSADEIVPTPLALERAHPPACPGSCRPATGVEALEARCGGGGGSGAVDCK